MSKRAKRHIASFLIALAMAAILLLLIVSTAEAKNVGMISRNADGDVFLSETGWVQVGSDTYYSHKTKSRMYQVGEACRNTYRWRGIKLYYFEDDAKMLRSNTKYIKLNKDHSVHYIYMPGTNHNDRYNARLGRYQKRDRKGRWKEYGMQTNIWWMCDMQE